MAGDGTARCHRVLQSDLTSPWRARRLIGDTLAAVGVSELAESAKLLVSEAVTNAVVHASTQVDLRACYSAGRLRVEVEDGSPHAPALPGQPGGAWGRGVLLLDALADRWGVERRRQSAKVVWFELFQGGGPHAATARRHPGAAHPPSVEVTLCGLPTSLTLQMLVQDESMLREITLVSLSEPATGTAGTPEATARKGRPASTEASALDLRDLASAADSARAVESPAFDTTLILPAGAAEDARAHLEIVEEGDRLAAAGRLLCEPASSEVASYRRWLLEEIASQSALREPGAPG